MSKIFLNKLEMRRYRRFKADHVKCNSNVHISQASPTGIGPTTIVECMGCHKTKDISDVGSW